MAHKDRLYKEKFHINGSCPWEPVPWYFLVDVNLPSRELSHILFRQGPFEDDFSLSLGGDTGYVSWRVSLPSAIAADDDIKPSETKAEVALYRESVGVCEFKGASLQMVKHRCYPLGSTFL